MEGKGISYEQMNSYSYVHLFHPFTHFGDRGGPHET